MTVEQTEGSIRGELIDAIGDTALLRVPSLSNLSGCEVFMKAEHLNPGGSIKDRTALGILLDAERKGLLKPGMCLVEGTAGNTGIGMATIAPQRGYRCTVFMPDNQSSEKYEVLRALGVEIHAVPAVPFNNPNHFYHSAQRWAAAAPDRFWLNQFENTANSQVHYQTTGQEIWQQTQGRIACFTSAVGTGGTISGVSRALKEKNSNVHIRLADPFGSGLHSWFTTGELKSTGSSITEGIGIMRITANFQTAQIDDSVQIGDEAMIAMLHHVAQEDGLLVGTSAALNLCAAFDWALAHRDSGKIVVTILCDSALRYASKVFRSEFLQQKGLQIKRLKDCFPALA